MSMVDVHISIEECRRRNVLSKVEDDEAFNNFSDNDDLFKMH